MMEYWNNGFWKYGIMIVLEKIQFNSSFFQLSVSAELSRGPLDKVHHFNVPIA